MQKKNNQISNKCFYSKYLINIIAWGIAYLRIYKNTNSYSVFVWIPSMKEFSFELLRTSRAFHRFPIGDRCLFLKENNTTRIKIRTCLLFLFVILYLRITIKIRFKKGISSRSIKTNDINMLMQSFYHFVKIDKVVKSFSWMFKRDHRAIEERDDH